MWFNTYSMTRYFLRRHTDMREEIIQPQSKGNVHCTLRIYDTNGKQPKEYDEYRRSKKNVENRKHKTMRGSL